MHFTHSIRAFLALALLALASQAPAAERLVVYTVNYPLQYFAQRIAGAHAELVFPAPADTDPAFWRPDPDTVTAYQRADLILLNGAGYANWTTRVSLPRLRSVDTSRGFRDRYIHTDGGVTHSHGPGGDHSHAGTAFTTWLDFAQAAQQARAVMEALAGKRPELRPELERNFAELEADLLGLDRRMRDIADSKPNEALVASHPVYQYLARRYGLNVKSVMWEPDLVPTQQQWGELEVGLQGHPARWMLWEAEPNPASVERLQALGVGSLVFAPCANRPLEGDFMAVMNQNLDNLQTAFR